MKGDGVFVGLEVVKATLDVAVAPDGENWQVPNDEGGIGELVGRATGTYHKPRVGTVDPLSLDISVGRHPLGRIVSCAALAW